MLKKFSVIVIFVIVANLLYAQFDFGAKFGANWSNIHYSSVSGNSNNFLGFSGGIMGDYCVNNNLKITSELLYTKRGYVDNDVMIDGKTDDLKVKFYYIDIPILAKINAYKGFNIQLGSQLGISLGNSAKFGTTNMNDEIAKPNFFDFGLVGGVGYELNNGLFWDFRYTYGLTHCYKDVSEGCQNRMFQLSIGYKIRWDRKNRNL